MSRFGLLLTAMFLPLPGLLAQDPTGNRPNIVVFLVDDMGWQDTSVPFWIDEASGEVQRTEFNRLYRTPNMERLAAQGVRFTNAYATALCSATRTSLMTGVNAARHRVTMWTLYPDRDQSGRTERLQSPPDWRRAGLQPADRTLPRLLQQEGYRTIHVGKAHWGAIGTPGSDPRALGFDRNVAGHAAGGPGSHHAIDGFGASKKVWAVPGLERYHGLEVSLTEALTIEANREVEEAMRAQRPFYLYLAHYAVHAPIQPHPPYVEKYRAAGLDEAEARYASMIESMDASLGAVLSNLERLGVADNTIVLFASDNGGLSVQARGRTPYDTGANTHNWPLRSGKGSAYEGGTRIPQIVAWAQAAPQHPAQQRIPVEQGGVRHLPTIVEDYFPTLLRWAGVDPPDPLSDGVVMNGFDFTGMLRVAGEQGQPGANSFGQLRRLRPLLWHFPHDWGPAGPDFEPHSAMRLGDWKVIYFYQPRSWELYNLAEDLSESRNLATKQPEQLRKMAAGLIGELEQADAQYPVQRDGGMPEPPLFLRSVAAGPVPLKEPAPGASDPLTPLVFIHGWSCNLHVFDRQLQNIGQTRRVLALDLPGHGLSLAPAPPHGADAYRLATSADAVAQAMDAAGIERAILVGHSNGAQVVREFLRRHRARAAGAVVLEGALRPMFPAEAAAGLLASIQGEGREATLNALAQGLVPRNGSAAEQQAVVDMVMQTPAEVQAASFLASVADDAWLPVQFDLPLLVINAVSPFWDQDYEDFVRGLGADVEYHLLDDVGHMIQIDGEREVHRLLNHWLQQHSL